MSAARTTTADGFEYESEPDSGFFVGSGETWNGVRVKYRKVGARKWTRFVIVHPADSLEIYLAIRVHAERGDTAA